MTVARAGGLRLEEPVVIHSASNVLVHLRPAPVVARVMTGTVVLHNDPRRWLERELSVLEFLAPTGLAVLPSRLIAPGPHRHDGLWITFTEWIPDIDQARCVEATAHVGEARVVGRALKELHDELRRFDGELGGPRELREDIERLLCQLQPPDAHESDVISTLRRRLDALPTVVFESSLPAQTLHGDVSLRNLLRPPGRLVWNDFEDTFRGPLHWDLASCVGSLRMQGANECAVSEMLDAYGWDDADELGPFLAAQEVYGEIWRMYDQQRRRA